MKRVGLLGGLAPPSTVDYYTRIIEVYRESRSDYPSILINSVDLELGLQLVTENRLDELADFLSGEVERLVAAGADFIALAANTPHIVFEELASRCVKPMISIVAATLEAAHTARASTALLLGTRFTMESGFYQRQFDRAGIRIVLPDDGARAFIHETYIGELIRGVFRPEAAERMVKIIRDTPAGIVILGGTELPLLLRGYDSGKTMLDTTEIHVARIVRELLS